MKLRELLFGELQKMGKALMLPVSVLPVAGILLGVGAAKFSFLPRALSLIMEKGGGAIFSSLPLVFALSVAIGLADNDGVAALAATVGLVVMLATMGVVAGLQGLTEQKVLGLASIDTGVFGGLLIGWIAARLFMRYYRIRLPDYLGFFQGKRFVPIVTAFAGIAAGLVLSVIWPPVQKVIGIVSTGAAYGNPLAAGTAYGFVERLLIPFGLHHIWNVPFFFEIGSFQKVGGEIVRGDIGRFLAGDPTAGILGGAYLFKMFGLPAAAIAMWHSARPENRVRVGSIMVSAALTSFLTGITEPIEFSFLFVAPQLYVAHAFLAAGSQTLFGALGGKMGFTFSHGAIDLVLYTHLGTRVWLFILLGPIYALIYYGLFRWAIQRFDLATPGREVESLVEGAPAAVQGDAQSQQLFEAFGGVANVKSLDACITRLRVSVFQVNLVRADRLRDMGASGVVVVGSSVQAVFGTRSESLKMQMELWLRSSTVSRDLPSPSDEWAEVPTELRPEPPDAADIERLEKMLTWLGGADVVTDVKVVSLTRLRLERQSTEPLDESGMEEVGVNALLVLPGGVTHLVVGPSAPRWAAWLNERVSSRKPSS